MRRKKKELGYLHCERGFWDERTGFGNPDPRPLLGFVFVHLGMDFACEMDGAASAYWVWMGD